MAQEIVRLCDACLADDVRSNSAAPYTVTVDSLSRVVDLCPDHTDSIIKPLEAMLGRWGQPVPDVPVKRKTRGKARAAVAEAAPVTEAPDRIYPCPLCDEAFAARSGINRHLAIHNVPTTYKMVAGRCPFDGVTLPAAGPTSLATHLLAEHGQPSITAAIVDARAAGQLDRRIARTLVKLQPIHDGA